MRADHLGCYGYDKPTSPRIDALAAHGVVFNNSYSASAWTLPSHATLFTGLYESVHRINRPTAHLSQNAVTLPGVLHAAGWHTAAVVCAPLLHKRYGLNRGFEIYDDKLIADSYEKAREVIVGEKVTDKALDYLDRYRDENLFLFLHYWDPHYDYIPPEPYARMFDPDYQGKIDGRNIHNRTDFVPGMNERDLQHIVALYDAEIRYTDDQIGRLLDGLAARGLADKTLIALIADHGEEFLDHGDTGHTHSCYEELVHVPIIFHAPWLKKPAQTIETPASLIDVFPTFAALLGIELPENNIQGVSLMPLMAEGRALQDRQLFMETRRGTLKRGEKEGYWRAVLSPERMKLHRFSPRNGESRVFMFDLTNDPQERTDLAAQREQTREELEHQLAIIQKRNGNLSHALHLGRREKLDKNLKDTLKGLGYL